MWKNFISRLATSTKQRPQVAEGLGVSDGAVKGSVVNSIKKYRQTYLNLEKYECGSQCSSKNLAEPDFVQKYLRKLSPTSQVPRTA